MRPVPSHLLRSARKRAILAYVHYHNPGFILERGGWGYVTLPQDIKNAMSKDLYYELLTQLILDKLIKQTHERIQFELITRWVTTKKGAKLAALICPEYSGCPGDLERRHQHMMHWILLLLTDDSLNWR